MRSKGLYLSVLLFCILFGRSYEELINGTIKLGVVTTAGCTDTVTFIQSHIVPTFAEFGRWMDIEFIPWGRTVRNENGSLSCQFGPDDCWANRVHRCALYMLRNDLHAQVNYMSCEFRHRQNRPAYLERSYICGFFAGLRRVELNRCVTSFIGEPLDHIAEMKSAKPMEIINYVPAVYFNDNPGSDWREIYSNLRNVVCDILKDVPWTGITEC